MKNNLKTFLSLSLMSYKSLYAFLDIKSFLLIKVLNPFFQLLFFILLIKYSYSPVDVKNHIMNNSLLLGAYNAFFGVGFVMLQERRSGTLSLIVASTINKFHFFIGRAFFHIIDGIFSVFLGLLLSCVFFNVGLSIENIIWFFIITICSMFSLMGFGLMIGSLGFYARDLNLLMNLCLFLLWILSGALVPSTNLPIVLAETSKFLPLSNSIEALNLLSGMASYLIIYPELLYEILKGILYFLIGYFSLIYFEKKSRNDASLDSY
ncbi:MULTISPECIES: ABC transporter permease [unclassified Paenibacillus]|uniref:ABC-2 type transporter transmembrane domain-containing protein n=2 Tax=Paenibacillus borealis TaxID=160799 RepID=A0ABX3GUB9_PAEBO|nr:hypothetical protein BSK56_33205 [Paenibacillus borealis]